MEGKRNAVLERGWHCLKTHGIQALSHSLNVTLWVVSVGPVLILYQNTKREKSTLTSKQTNEH